MDGWREAYYPSSSALNYLNANESEREEGRKVMKMMGRRWFKGKWEGVWRERTAEGG